MVGITNYKKMFEKVDNNPNLINGLSCVHAIRIVARRGALPSETGVDVHYKKDFTERENWFPLPAPALVDVGNFNSTFWDEQYGYPIFCGKHTAVTARRMRQQYLYEVVYPGGQIKTFLLPCPSQKM